MNDNPTTAQKLLAEGLGTALLVFIGAGSVPATLILNGGTLDMADLGVISFAFAMVIIAAVYALGPISGCHINPAVTVGLAATGKFPWREVPGYVIAQVIGAIVGAAGIIAALGTAAIDNGLGVNSYGTSWGTAFAAETIGTFILVITILGVIYRKAAPGFFGLAIGFVVFAIIIAIGPTSGGSINPARYFGPLLLQSFLGESGSVDWGQLPVYVIAQLLGAVIAAGVYAVLFRTPADKEAEAATA